MDGAPSYTQTGRDLAIQTPLGENMFLLEGMDGSEALSSLFSFSLRVRAMTDSIDPAQLITKSVDWQLRLDGGSWRPFNGLVANFSGGEAMARGQRSYTLMVVPWLWFLQHRQDSRVFQNNTVVQIATQIFTELGFKDFDTSGLANEYKPRLYCVQYRESDFNFVSRLFEEEGIFYYFQHSQGRHVMMLCDGAHAYKDIADGTLPYSPSAIFHNSVASWMHHQTFRSGRATTSDYDFQNPGNSLITTTAGLSPIPMASQFEIFDFPGRYTQRDRGEGISSRLIASHEKGQDTISAGGNARTLVPAGRFQLEAHPIAAENVKYVIVSQVHHATDPSFESVGKGAPKYQNSFTCLPANVDFVPEQRSEKPVIPGMQSAVVVGPAGEEIYTDRYGRIKVQFHWDRKGQNNETSSCWMRVAQPWAGRGFGAQTIPRIGMEVGVCFMEGDPDNPVVVCCMPNANTIPSIKLPDEKERSSFRTASSPGGNGFNELTMEDKAGSEEVFLHAQKDFSHMVGNNLRLNVGNVLAQATETLWLSTVHDSVIEKTQDHILIQHQDSQIYLDANGIRISFGAGHMITLNAEGVHLHSAAQVDASQGDPSAPPNSVSVAPAGVQTKGGVVLTTAGNGASTIEMGAAGIAQTGPKIWLNS
jgi:type VI secretion system secreted protein VgrG